MQSRTSFLKQRFPDKWKDIEKILSKNPELSSICSDLEDAWESYKYWNKLGKHSKIISDEYEKLLQELEEELKFYIELEDNN
jgi:hypothetical protein